MYSNKAGIANCDSSFFLLHHYFLDGAVAHLDDVQAVLQSRDAFALRIVDAGRRIQL